MICENCEQDLKSKGGETEYLEKCRSGYGAKQVMTESRHCCQWKAVSSSAHVVYWYRYHTADTRHQAALLLIDTYILHYWLRKRTLDVSLYLQYTVALMFSSFNLYNALNSIQPTIYCTFTYKHLKSFIATFHFLILNAMFCIAVLWLVIS